MWNPTCCLKTMFILLQCGEVHILTVYHSFEAQGNLTVYVSIKYRKQAYIFQSLICPGVFCQAIKTQDWKSPSIFFHSSVMHCYECENETCFMLLLLLNILTKCLGYTGQKRVLNKRLKAQYRHIHQQSIYIGKNRMIYYKFSVALNIIPKINEEF